MVGMKRLGIDSLSEVDHERLGPLDNNYNVIEHSHSLSWKG
jgi:hypothetical protein